jgi:NAD(P)-dependent dehydrogenase (short-subunit alcohol dehydrogenase family)
MAFFAGFIHRQFIYEPPVPTASFKGKTVIVTGSSSGLGLEACRWMVRLGAARVILACRNADKGKAAAKDIQATTSCSPDTLEVWNLDMSSYASVQAFSDRAKAELPRLDVLILNAGIGTLKFRKTEDNEETITTNVVSMSLIAFLLHPKLRETAEQQNTQTHLTLTASELYEVAKFKERNAPASNIFATLNDERNANMSDRYNVSKLLGIFVIKQMAALSPLSSSNVIVNSVAPGYVFPPPHPGLTMDVAAVPPDQLLSFFALPSFCHSELHREHDSAPVRLAMKVLCRPTEVGSRTLVYGASAGPESHGQYVPDCKITPTRGLTKGEAGAELQARVWAELRKKLEGIRPGVTSLT